MSDELLERMFEAERTLRQAEHELLQRPSRTLVRSLSDAVHEARALTDRNEAALRLQRLADLCAQVEGPEMVDALIAIADDDAPATRVAATEALADVAFERYAEVARGVERALQERRDRDRAGHAMEEVPWVILEVEEPSARKLLTRFLQLRDANAVASAVEALAHLGDPAAADDLRPLANDTRAIDPEDEEQESNELGVLVREALDILTGA